MLAVAALSAALIFDGGPHVLDFGRICRVPLPLLFVAIEVPLAAILVASAIRDTRLVAA